MTALTPLDFELTPEDRAKAAAARVHLERWRIERNRRDDAREQTAKPDVCDG
jgi:hypothetical protein